MWRLLDDVVDAGFDILNPVQTSAADMDPVRLKETYGDRVTFWGGGIETQTSLPFGTPDEVRAMVKERMRIFGPGGGYVFNTIHNLQAGVPVENIARPLRGRQRIPDLPVRLKEARMALIDELRRAVVDGQAEGGGREDDPGLAEGMPAVDAPPGRPDRGDAEVGELYDQGEYYVPEMLVAAHAMKESLAVLQTAPRLRRRPGSPRRSRSGR